MATEGTRRSKRGLASASEETRARVARGGGVARHNISLLLQPTPKLGYVCQGLEAKRGRTIETVSETLAEKEDRALKQSTE
jgi:hypothetical protein